MSSNCTDWWQMSNTIPRWRRTAPKTSLAGSPVRRARVAVPAGDQTSRLEPLHRLRGRLQQAGRLGLERELDPPPGAPFEVDEVGHDPQDVLGQRPPGRRERSPWAGRRAASSGSTVRRGPGVISARMSATWQV